MRIRLPFLISLVAVKLVAQETPDSTAVMKQILERLDSLEKENRQLVEEVRSLRQELNASRANTAASAPPSANQSTLNERVTVEEHRTAEQAQTKVEAAHKFPIQLDGMLLFNAFANSADYEAQNTAEYGLLSGPNRSGATFRQSILGLDFQGPSLPGDGRINGYLMMDFFAGYPDPQSIRIRLRRAGLSFDWKNRSFSVGQDKPLISPYQPDSLAEVGIPPLAGAGNLWLWLPQARYEERVALGTGTGLTGQVALMQTEETYASRPASSTYSLEPARPALEGRLAFWHKFDDTRRFEFAPGFHLSTTHVAGASVGSHIGSLDWLLVPASHFQLSGTFYKGQNVASLGSLGNGFTILSNDTVRPVDSTGGWAQAAFPITNRLTFDIYSGLENDHGVYLSDSNIVHNWMYAANVMYHLGPNVIVSAEALQMRTRSFYGIGGVQNHYDLAFAYLF